MAPPADPNQAREKAKRLREKLLIALTLMLVASITSVEVYLVRQGGHPVTGSLLAFGLLNLNTLLLLLLTFLFFRHLSKLFLERRQKVFGSRLRTRLVLTFLSLALLPTLFMFFLAWQLISSRVDLPWNPRVEETLEQTLELSRAYSLALEDKLKAAARLLSRDLEDDEDQLSPENREGLKNSLERQRAILGVTALEVLDPGGARVAASWDPLAKQPEGPALPPELKQFPAFQRLAEPGGGALAGYFMPLKGAEGGFRGYLAVRQFIPASYLAQSAGAEKNVQELRQLQTLLRPVRVGHFMTLVIVTLLVVMSAVWLAFYMAREITTPIRQLAEGTLKVAGGDYDIHIDQEGRDEIGFLVQSFNKMTQDLQHSQTQLAAAYRELSLSHQELEAGKRHMEILLKNVAAGVIGIDPSGRISAINDSAAQMLRVQRDEVLGQDCRALLPAHEYHRLAEVIAEARHSQTTLERPFQLHLPDRTLYLLLKPTVLKDDTGQNLGIVMVFEDMTELERAQRLAAWREVARRIAHEVKNPLTPIKLAAQRLQRRFLGSAGEDARLLEECTQIIISQVDELKNLVNEFSRFARLPQLFPALQDLNTLVAETLLLYREVQPRITLEFQADPSLPPLLVDREQLKRALINLLDNALTSIPESGSITITLSQDEARDLVRLVVADTGLGIPQRDQARIFEPYFSTKRGGTGLGLAIVNSIVTEHQGTIRVEDNLPHGSRFIIELPRKRGTDLAETEAPGALAAPTHHPPKAVGDS